MSEVIDLNPSSRHLIFQLIVWNIHYRSVLHDNDNNQQKVPLKTLGNA